MGCQWKELPIKKNKKGKAEIHYTTIYKVYARWCSDGSLSSIFEASVKYLKQKKKLDVSVLHGDGTITVSKKGGAGVGYSGHKHLKGDKVVAIVDKNGFVVSPFTIAPANRNDCILLPDSLKHLSRISKKIGFSIKGSYLNLDGVFDSRKNRKCIFNRGMIPNIPYNPRGRKKPKRGRKRLFNMHVYISRFTVERTFSWEDKFRRLLIRFERIPERHLGFKLLAYTMINLREFCT